jgi:hypothetical protein
MAMKSFCEKASSAGFSLMERKLTNGTQSGPEVYNIYNISNHPAVKSTKGEVSK